MSNDLGWFSSIPALTVFVIQRYYCKLLYGIALYDHLLDDLVLQKKLVIYGGSKLGLIRRLLGIASKDEERPSQKDESSKMEQYSIHITKDFADSIKDLINSTGFYKNRTQFCRDAIGFWIAEQFSLQALAGGLKNESSDLFRVGYDGAVDNTYQYYNSHNVPYFFPGYTSHPSDSKGWLDKTYVEEQKEVERRLDEINRRESDE